MDNMTNEIEKMTENLRKYYEECLYMFSIPGWKYLVEDVERMMGATGNISNVKDADDLRFKQGELSIMRWLISREEAFKTAYEDMKKENA